MVNKYKKHNRGFNLIEVMVTIVILMAVIVGTTAYRYYATLDARRSDLHITACRLGLMMLETWKGQGCADDFDPVSLLGSDLSISSLGSVQPLAGLSSPIGSYKVFAGGTNYYVTLSCKDTADEPRLINVAVSWGQRDYGEGSYSDSAKLLSWTAYEGY